jgi:DNA repair exonuclease SbcCD ATPase subunit
MKNTILLNIAGGISLSSLTAACAVGEGFLNTALQVNSLLFGLSYCYYGDRNPIRILGDLKIRVSKLEQSRSQLVAECDRLQGNKEALHSLQAIEALIESKEAALQQTEQRYSQKWADREAALNQRTADIEKFLEDEKGKINQLSLERSQSLDQRETLIQQELERINEELEADKKQFLEEHGRAIASLEDEIYIEPR